MGGRGGGDICSIEGKHSQKQCPERHYIKEYRNIILCIHKLRRVDNCVAIRPWVTSEILHSKFFYNVNLIK